MAFVEPNFTPVISPGASRVREVLHEAGYRAVFVGGCVRDMLLGRRVTDWDIATSARPAEVVQLFSRHQIKVRPTGLQHGTVTVLWENLGYEITTFREEDGYSDGRRPDHVRFTDSLTQDLSRRDFTINAMAWEPEKGLVDPFAGQADIRDGLVRAVGEPGLRFAEDALRMMRAVRFAGQLGFAIEAKTQDAIRAQAQALTRVSMERIASEWVQTAVSSHPQALLLFHQLGLFAVFLPELEACFALPTGSGRSIGEHCIDVAALTPPIATLRIAALLHDVARMPDPGPGTDDHAARSAVVADRVLRRLRFATRDREQIVWLIRTHDDPIPSTPVAARRLLSAASPARWQAWIDLVRADIRANHPFDTSARLEQLTRVADWIRGSLQRKEPYAIAQLAVDGQDALHMGFDGPAIGAVLERLLEQVLVNPSLNTRSHLLASMRQIQKEAQAI